VKKSCFTIVLYRRIDSRAFRKSQAPAAKTPEPCRKHGIDSATFCAGKSKVGGMEVSDVAKMRSLEDEKRRLNKLLADSALEIDALKLIASGNF
jgi:putative transposase